MNRHIILFSIVVVGLLAFVDAKTRLDELESFAATTPSQVEMKRDVQKSAGLGVQDKVNSSTRMPASPKSPANNPKFQNQPQKFNPDFKNTQRP